MRALPFYYQLIIMSGKQAKTCQIIAVDYFLFFSSFAGEPTSNPELYSQVTCRKESPYHGFNGHFCWENHIDQSSRSQAGRVPGLTGHNTLFDYLILRFIYSEKATKFCEIFPLLLTAVTSVTQKSWPSAVVYHYCAWSAFLRNRRYIQSKVRGRFRKILWLSQNIWTLKNKMNS